MDLIKTHEKQTAAAEAGISVATGRRLHYDPRRPAYRRAYDALIAALPQKAACRAAIALLALAHEEGCEADLAGALDAILDAGDIPDPDVLRQRFARRDGPAPDVVVTLPSSAAYDALLNAPSWMCGFCSLSIVACRPAGSHVWPITPLTGSP